MASFENIIPIFLEERVFDTSLWKKYRELDKVLVFGIETIHNYQNTG